MDQRQSPPTAEETVAADRASLHVEHFDPPGPARLVLVMVHGFAAHCGLYRHVAAQLAAQHVAVTAFDCRGHGRSEGRRGYVRRFADYVADLELVIARAQTRHSGLPLVLMGHSQGALILLDAVLSGAAKPNRLVLAAPWLRLALKVPMVKRVAGQVLRVVWPTLALGNEIRGEDVSSNPQVIANFEQDPLVHHVASARWYYQALAAQDRVYAAAGQLRVPTLMLVVGQDRIASTEGSLTFARAAGQCVQVRHYERFFHEIFLEQAWADVVSDIGRWLHTPSSEIVDPVRAPGAVAGIL